MGAQNDAQVVATEIERVRPKLPTLFDWDDVWYSSIEKKDVEMISNRDMRVPLEIKPGGRFGHMDPDGGDMGVGGGPTYDKGVVGAQFLKHAVQWTKKAEWGTDNKRKAVINTFRRLLATQMKEFRRHVNGLSQGAGDGVVATVTAVSTAGNKDTVTCTTDGFKTKLLRFGHGYSVYNSTLTVRRTFTLNDSYGGHAPIDLLDPDVSQARFSGTTGATVAGDKIVVEGLSATPPVSLFGVAYHHSNASTGNWLGIDRATNPEVRASRTNASGALALPFPRLAANKIGDRIGSDNLKKSLTAWMHPAQKQAYEELGMLVSQIHKSAKDESLDLYFGDNMQMAGAPVKTDYMWDRKRIDFVDPDLWGRGEVTPVDFYEVEGRRIFEMRGATGGVATAMIFYICAAFQIFVSNPAGCSYIDGLTVPTGY